MWRMVWEQDSYSIVMVTSLVENGRVRELCIIYFCVVFFFVSDKPLYRVYNKKVDKSEIVLYFVRRLIFLLK